jgi:hypothetical protein
LKFKEFNNEDDAINHSCYALLRIRFCRNLLNVFRTNNS